MENENRNAIVVSVGVNLCVYYLVVSKSDTYMYMTCVVHVYLHTVYPHIQYTINYTYM